MKKNAEINNQKQIIEKANENLLSSIRYASKIQEAFFPDAKQFEQTVSEHFIFYKPKDVVGGDFYWTKKTEKWRIVCLGDCTGHGVPGALLSITCISILDKLSKMEPENPGKFLLDIQKELTDSLSDSEIQDGLDLSVCFISIDGKILEFAAAHQSLITIVNGEAVEIKGDRRGLGKDYRQIENEFTSHILKLNGKEKFVLFSDGICDQFGGPNDKKIGKRQFINKLKNSANLDIQTSGEQMTSFFDSWKKDNPATDDVTVLIFSS
jgi:serine phosphatase RsbU (regulator of sigma subunit)